MMNYELINVIKTLNDKSYKVIFIGVHGSYLYGLNTPDSDIDYKGVYIPSKEDMLLCNVQHEINFSTGAKDEKNVAGDIDIKLFSIQKFMKMLADGETIAIDMIHTNEENEIYTSNAWSYIKSHRGLAYTKNMKAFLGYVKKQAHKYGIRGSRIEAIETTIDYLKKKYELLIKDELKPRLDSHPLVVMGLEGIALSNEYVNFFKEGIQDVNKPLFEVAGSKFSIRTPIKQIIESLESKLKGYGHRAQQAKENSGLDFKALSHAIRCGYQLKEIYETGDLKYPLKDAKFLLEVKQGKHDFLTVIEPTINSIVDEVELLSSNSCYPEEVDKKALDNIVLSVIENQL